MLEGGVVSRDGCRVGVVSERVGKDCVCTCSAIYEMLFFLNAFSLLLTIVASLELTCFFPAESKHTTQSIQ